MTILPAVIFRKRASALPRSRLTDHLERFWPAGQPVLLLGDDGYRITMLDRQRQLKTLFVQAGDDGRKTIGDWLLRHNVRRLRIVCDNTGQSYAREDVPKASRKDQAFILKRRLDARFGKSALTTLLAVDDVAAPTKTADEAILNKTFLLAALADEKEIQSWIDDLAKVEIEVTSISLLPLEWAAALPITLGLSADELTGAVWRMVVTRHRTGGIRHVVLRGGQLVLTRLTLDHAKSSGTGSEVNASPDTSAESPNEAFMDDWDFHLLSEIEASIGYIKRFGYTADQQLQVSLVGGDAFTRLVEDVHSTSKTHWQAHHINDIYGSLRISPPDSDEPNATEWGDCLIAAMMASRSVRQPLSSPDWRQLQRRRQQHGLVQAAMILLMVSLAGVSGWLGWELYQKTVLKQNMTAELAGLKQAHTEVREQTTNLPEGLDSLRHLLGAFDQHYEFEQGAPKLHKAIIRSLGPELRLNRLLWSLRFQDNGAPVTHVDLGLDLRRAGSIDEAEGLVDGFLNRLTSSLPPDQIELGEVEVPLAGSLQTSGSWSAAEPDDGETDALVGRIVLLVKGEN